MTEDLLTVGGEPRFKGKQESRSFNQDGLRKYFKQIYK